MGSENNELIAHIVAFVSAMDPDVKQGWIDNPDALNKALQNALCSPQPTHSWREEDGIIYFSVTSDGTRGEDWIKRLEGNNIGLTNYAKYLLLSSVFIPTNGVTTKVAVLRCRSFKKKDRITKNVYIEAARRSLNRLNVEVACLISEKFTNEDIKAMGLWRIVTVHKPINNYADRPSLLVVGRSNYVCRTSLSTFLDLPDSKLDNGNGLAFEVPQVSSQH